MKYPKEAIEAEISRMPWLANSQEANNWRAIFEYAKWAHEQLRPRSISEDPLKGGLSGHYIMARFVDGIRSITVNKNGPTLKDLGVICWYLVPPSPEEDPFKAWTVKTYGEFGLGKCSEAMLRETWDAALAYAKGATE